MGEFFQGIDSVPNQQAAIRNEISQFATNWFVNRTPLISRLPRERIGAVRFQIINRYFRRRSTTLGAAVVDGTTTSVTLADASSYMVGDVLELASGERVEITADPNTTTNVITVRRGVEGTTAAAQANGTAVFLIGNSRTGREIDQNAIAFTPVVVDQYCQTFQHAVQVGGSLESSTEYVGPSGRSPFDANKMDALQNLMDDIEVSSYYGKGEAASVGGRPKQKGLRTLIGNIVTSPTNASAYKPTDLIRDAFETPWANGGNPDVLIVSTNFMSGLATWGHPAQRLDAGENVFGTPIDVFEAPFLGGVKLIPAPLLRPFTAIALTSAEVRLRMKRNEFWNPRGNRGDAVEGDWIAEAAIELVNPNHHAWVQGITAFSA